MTRRFSATHLTVALMIGLAIGALVERPFSTAEARDRQASDQITASNIAINSSSQPGISFSEGDELRASITAERDAWLTDSNHGGSLSFFTRGKEGELERKMRLTKEGCFLLGNKGAIAGIPGTIETSMEHSSRPGALVLRNTHEPKIGCGVTLAFYASGEHQASISSSWIGPTRRVKQIDKPNLPHTYESTPYPNPRSASRVEINGRVNDWASNMAIFEPIADDGKAFVTVDRQHPWMGMVQYLPPSGEWINGRRIGRHALLVGTTHNTGATAGGIVAAGDTYHENLGRGPVIKSPNGTAFRIVVDDDGNLSTEKF